MQKMLIKGGNRLTGEAVVHGAKNSVLPILAACYAIGEPCELHNCPRLTDVDASLEILRHIGCQAAIDGPVVNVDASGAVCSDIPERLMREMRSSISFLGAIVARCGRAQMSLPGGCELGERPVDLHLDALVRMGAQITESHGFIHCVTEGGLKGAQIPLSFPSVGATENIMVAAATADGTTTIINAAREPEIIDLARFLNACGARITGYGESVVTIEGVERLHGCVHKIIPDRIVAATIMSAAAITGGDVLLKNVDVEHLIPFAPVFEEMGCKLLVNNGALRVIAPKRLSPIRFLRTMPYPGFPTDAQALVMAASCVAQGTSIIAETIFDNRFKHVGELRRLGANIKTEGRVAVVNGVQGLTGAAVTGTDLRGTAALVIAGLAASETTELYGLRHLDRGYEAPEETLRQLGADIVRVTEESKDTDYSESAGE